MRKLRIDAAQGVASALGSENEEFMGLAESIARDQELKSFSNLAESVRFLKDLLDSRPALLGTYLDYKPIPEEPIVDDPSLPPGAFGADGRFTPYFVRDWRQRGLIIVKPNVDQEESLYYGGVQSEFKHRGT